MIAGSIDALFHPDSLLADLVALIIYAISRNLYMYMHCTLPNHFADTGSS